MRIRLPANGWVPRRDQRPLWDYLEQGGKHAEVIAHRRWGKDDVALHRTALAAFERTAGYWHMLPEYSQARKAIWDAINPHTGKRRIDEAFPQELRQTTREQEMQIVFLNGSTWQVVGSDSYNRLVGSAPAGVVYSEWALANPAARGYLRPILAENGGWQMFITTPRGKNHAYQTFRAAQKDPNALALLCPATETPVFTPEQLESERQAYINEFGEDQGQALYDQEYLCSWDAAIMGSYYGKEVAKLKAENRLTEVKYVPEYPVNTAWDLGWSDDTAIWWYQVIAGEVRILECHSSNGQPISYYADLIESKPYRYGKHWLPHDAKAKTLASGGKSIEEMLAARLGWKAIRIVPQLGLQDGIQAARQIFPKVWIDRGCEDGLESLSMYRREYDDEKRVFRDKPLHDFTSHLADAFRMLAVAWKSERPQKPEPKTFDINPADFRTPQNVTINQLIAQQTAKRMAME